MVRSPGSRQRIRLEATFAVAGFVLSILVLVGGNVSAADVPSPDQFAISIGDTVSESDPGPGAGIIEIPGVRDIYTFTAVPGQEVFFDIQDQSGLITTAWSLVDEDGTIIFASSLGSGDAGLHRLGLGGTYTLTVGEDDEATGTYQFQLLRVFELPSVPDDTAPFDLPDNISCDDGASEGDADTRILVVRPDLGEPIICTSDAEHQPVPDGTIVVRVSTDVPTDDVLFEFDTFGAIHTIAANDSFSVPISVEAGDSVFHSVLLLGPPAGWDLTGVECDDTDSANRSHGSVPDQSAKYGIDPGETVVCEFELSSLGAETADPLDDSERVLPLSGEWSIKNVASEMKCGGRNIDIGTARPDSVTLDVRRGGDQLVGRSSVEGRNRRLTLKAKGTDRYEGKRKEKAQGKNITFSYSWRVVSPERMVGSATAKIKAQGANCKITRRFEMTYEGSG
jgi:hypothetical protein